MHLSTVETVLEYQVLSPTHFCFNIEAAHWPTQKILSERLSISSGVSPHSYVDPRSGNRFIRFDAGPGPLRVNYKAEVEVHTPPHQEDLKETPVSQVPDEIFPYLLATRYCESDVLCNEVVKLFGNIPPGYARVRAIEEWIRAHITYKSGSTDANTTAQQVFGQRMGVCRDFAHLGITFCRALNIPARMVVGYVWFDEPPQDFHALFEAWLDGHWVLFDPTGMAPVDRVVRIGTGRDAKDVAFATMFGALQMTRKEVMVLEHDPRPRHAPAPTSAPALAAARQAIA
ncbi:transglutaminase family protein [Ramlibacter sp. USB13]|uniref:Transglutaminase family protein n=1 Tax=Ramlibacter cellulosilyticus TaxID=2764187 RepID=A0A923SAA5_9BURK|nr:transglutaminase family protein [Ramlibacter cellulosilyticus]MBC5782576.1 transglutaminase family protein [Ramlibacter cellulosilyticus]